MSKLDLNYREVRLIYAGLEKRDRHNIKIINGAVKNSLYGTSDIARENARKEHMEIQEIRKKLDEYDKAMREDVKEVDEAGETAIHKLSMEVDLNIDEAMQKLENMKALMLDTDKMKEKLPSKTYILKAKQALHKDHIDNAERELCKKLNASVVILPNTYDFLGMAEQMQKEIDLYDSNKWKEVIQNYDGIRCSLAVMDEIYTTKPINQQKIKLVSKEDFLKFRLEIAKERAEKDFNKISKGHKYLVYKYNEPEKRTDFYSLDYIYNNIDTSCTIFK